MTKRPLTAEEIAELDALRDERRQLMEAEKALTAREREVAARLYPAVTGLQLDQPYTTHRAVRSYSPGHGDKTVKFNFMPVAARISYTFGGKVTVAATLRQLNSKGEYGGRTGELTREQLDAAVPMELK